MPEVVVHKVVLLLPRRARSTSVGGATCRSLTPAESNYAPIKGECLALVWATRKFRQFLHGQRFTLRTDHAALKWPNTVRFENLKLERWAVRLQEFDFEVEYLPGENNVVADHLSRHYPHLGAGSALAVAGHLAFATLVVHLTLLHTAVM